MPNEAEMRTGIEVKDPETKEKELILAFEELVGRAPGNYDLKGNENVGLFAGFRDEKICVSWGRENHLKPSY